MQTASAPVRWLEKNERLGSVVFDYGCGRGADVDWLRDTGRLSAGYDPVHRRLLNPGRTTAAWNDTCSNGMTYLEGSLAASDAVLCTYVLNTVSEETQEEILNTLRSSVKYGAPIYITVRRDIKKEGVTKRNTYQRMVYLDLPTVRETSTYCIYMMRGRKKK